MAITLTQLHSFTAVVRTSSVSAAAEELYVTQPSVSAALAALNREVGTELFERNGRNLKLSAAGNVFAQYASNVLGLLSQGVTAALEASGAASRHLRIAAVTTAGEYLAPLLIRAFVAYRPDVSVELHVGNRKRVFDLARTHEADVAIGGRPPVETDFEATPFLKNEIVLVTAPDDPLARRSEVQVAELAQRTWLLREEGSGTRAMSEEFLSLHDLRPRVLTLGSNGSIKQAARLGLGISLQSRVAVDDELRHGELRTIAIPEPGLHRHWFVLRATEGPVREPVVAFLDFITRAQRVPELAHWQLPPDESGISTASTPPVAMNV